MFKIETTPLYWDIIVAILSRHDTQARIQRYTRKAKTSVKSNLDRLEREGYVTKDKQYYSVNLNKLIEYWETRNKGIKEMFKTMTKEGKAPLTFFRVLAVYEEEQKNFKTIDEIGTWLITLKHLVKHSPEIKAAIEENVDLEEMIFADKELALKVKKVGQIEEKHHNEKQG